MKEFFKYVGAGIVGTCIIAIVLGLVLVYPIIPTVFATAVIAVLTLALFLFPGACVYYAIKAVGGRKKKSDE